MGDRYRPFDPEHPSPLTPEGERARANARLTKADRDELRAKRTEAVRLAFPAMTQAHVDQAVAAFYRGKPGSARIRRAIARAGLL